MIPVRKCAFRVDMRQNHTAPVPGKTAPESSEQAEPLAEQRAEEYSDWSQARRTVRSQFSHIWNRTPPTAFPMTPPKLEPEMTIACVWGRALWLGYSVETGTT